MIEDDPTVAEIVVKYLEREGTRPRGSPAAPPAWPSPWNRSPTSWSST